MKTIAEADGTTWVGVAELWLDPLGEQATRSDCSLVIEKNVVRSTWTHEGKAQQGSITLGPDGGEFVDSWHQPEPMRCRNVPGGRGLFKIEGSYGPHGEWGWRIGLGLRDPSRELVLQMINVAPWGEETRAVRLICVRQP